MIIGLANGLIFALVALGYTLVYGIIELINFAHGDVFMLGSIWRCLPRHRADLHLTGETPVLLTIGVILRISASSCSYRGAQRPHRADRLQAAAATRRSSRR